MKNSVKQKATKSLVWSFIEKMSVQGVGFFIGLILARLLAPEDYGIIAMLYIFIAVATVFIDGGFSNALIQNQNRTQIDFSTAFWVNVIVAILCYLALFICAPYMAEYFEQPRLEKVTRVYGLSLVISSLALVQKSRFYISYNFKLVAYVSFVAILISGVIAILMACRGWGVWALVWYNLILETVRTIGFWIFGKWVPRWEFSFKSFCGIFSFGSKLLGANIINVIASNLYTFVVGKFFNAAQLGFYSRGQSMAYIIPSNFSNIMTQASYPVLCEVQNNQEKLKEYFVKYVKCSFMLIAPVMTMLAALASPLVTVILTEKWLPCVPFIQILAIGYMFDTVMRLNASVINVTGHSEYSFYAEVLKKIALVGLLMITCHWGIIPLTIGLAFYSVVDLMIIGIFLKKVVGFCFYDELKQIFPYMVFCIVSFYGIKGVMEFIQGQFLQIFLGVIVGLLIYILQVLLFQRTFVLSLVDLNKRNENTVLL